MGYITVSTQFQNAQLMVASACNQNFADMTSGMSSGGSDFNVYNFTANGSAVVAGDIYTVPFYNWFANANPVGWGSFLYSQIQVKKVGKTVYLNYYIQGYPSAATAYFTLPYNVNAASIFQAASMVFTAFNTDNATCVVGDAYIVYPNILAINLTQSGVTGLWNTIYSANAKITWGNINYESV